MFKKILKRYIIAIGIAQAVNNLINLIALYGPQDNSVVTGIRSGLKIHHTGQAIQYGLNADEFEVFKTMYDLHKEN